MKRKQHRAPNLTTLDRVVFAVASVFISPSRLPKLSIAVAHSTLLTFHKSLVHRKYKGLFSRRTQRPGPKGPSRKLIRSIVEVKQKNPRYGYPRIALLVSKVLGLEIDERFVRRVLRRHLPFSPSGGGESWLSAIGSSQGKLWSMDLFRVESIFLRTHWVMVVMDIYSRQLIGFAAQVGAPSGEDVCSMFSSIKFGHNLPTSLSTDNHPLFQNKQWKSMLSILEVEEIKSVSECPRSHPFIERLIGTVRREYLDEQVFWNKRDLLFKLNEFKEYYNSSRVHYSLDGLSFLEKCKKAVVSRISLESYRWKSHCGGRFSVPIAA